jgi:hypothetical protein
MLKFSRAEIQQLTHRRQEARSARINSSLVRNFEVARNGQSGALAGQSVLPSRLQAEIALHDPSLNLDAAQNGETNNGTVWVVPGSSSMCLFYDGAETCGGLTGADNVNTGSLRMTNRAPNGPEVIVGLVPNTNKSVSVNLADGSSVTAPVTDNVYSVSVQTPPTSVVTRDATGSPHSWYVR